MCTLKKLTKHFMNYFENGTPRIFHCRFKKSESSATFCFVADDFARASEYAVLKFKEHFPKAKVSILDNSKIITEAGFGKSNCKVSLSVFYIELDF